MYHAAGVVVWERRAWLLTSDVSASRCRGPRLTACSNFNLCFKYEACRKASPRGWKLLGDWTLCLLAHFYLRSKLLSIWNKINLYSNFILFAQATRRMHNFPAGPIFKVSPGSLGKHPNEKWMFCSVLPALWVGREPGNIPAAVRVKLH